MRLSLVKPRPAANGKPIWLRSIPIILNLDSSPLLAARIVLSAPFPSQRPEKQRKQTRTRPFPQFPWVNVLFCSFKE